MSAKKSPKKNAKKNTKKNIKKNTKKNASKNSYGKYVFALMVAIFAIVLSILNWYVTIYAGEGMFSVEEHWFGTSVTLVFINLLFVFISSGFIIVIYALIDALFSEKSFENSMRDKPLIDRNVQIGFVIIFLAGLAGNYKLTQEHRQYAKEYNEKKFKLDQAFSSFITKEGPKYNLRSTENNETATAQYKKGIDKGIIVNIDKEKKYSLHKSQMEISSLYCAEKLEELKWIVFLHRKVEKISYDWKGSKEDIYLETIDFALVDFSSKTNTYTWSKKAQVPSEPRFLQDLYSLEDETIVAEIHGNLKKLYLAEEKTSEANK